MSALERLFEGPLLADIARSQQIALRHDCRLIFSPLSGTVV